MRLNSFLTFNTPEPSVFGSRQCTRAHFHSLWARVVSLILVCLGPSSTPGSTFTPRRLGLSHRAHYVWVQVVRSNPLSPLMGSGYHALVKRVWVQVAHSDPLSPLIGSGTFTEPNIP